MTDGYVVESLETGLRYARSEKNFNPDREKKIRELKPGESSIAYQPRQKQVAAVVAVPDTPHPPVFGETNQERTGK